MILRRARVDDAQQIIILLNQVLAVHNKIRPDIFLSSGSKYTDKQLEDSGIGADLIRMSVGVEHIDDIIADIEQALAQV